MFGQLTISDYKLTDLLGSASATIGIIISGTIFLQFMSSKSMELASRYRQLAQEYRGGNAPDSRHGLLQGELHLYRRRLYLMNRASWFAGVALLFFLASVVFGGLSMVFPTGEFFRILGTAGLFLGLALMSIAVLFELIESVLSRHELNHESGDLDAAARR